MNQQTNNDLGHTLGRIEATLEKFGETLERFDHHLFGNGQPGALKDLGAEIAKVDARVDRHEEFKTFIKGGFTAISGLIALLGGTELYHLFFGRGK